MGGHIRLEHVLAIVLRRMKVDHARQTPPAKAMRTLKDFVLFSVD